MRWIGEILAGSGEAEKLARGEFPWGRRKAVLPPAARVREAAPGGSSVTAVTEWRRLYEDGLSVRQAVDPFGVHQAETAILEGPAERHRAPLRRNSYVAEDFARARMFHHVVRRCDRNISCQ